MDYTQISDSQRETMLKAIGVASVEELFSALPAGARLNRLLDLPPALSEPALQRLLSQRSGLNRTAASRACFMGCGAYDHFIPAVIDALISRGEFLTAYTPYQAEASQGSLQAFFEFQTQVCRLTGLDVANASLYEGATAVVEAVFMAVNTTGRRRVLVAGSLPPHYMAVLRTACADMEIQLVLIPSCASTGLLEIQAVRSALNDATACLVVQSPNVWGLIEDWTGLFQAAHAQTGTLAVAVFNPIACALLKNPGLCGADIAAGEGQPLGVPLQYGGPWLGLFAARQALVRRMPGRLVGMTTDNEGRRGFCLTLQTREQHIRGAKATSNVCTNQGLLALRATMYLTLMGPQGLRTAAESCYHKAHEAARAIAAIPGYSLAWPSSAFFHEFLVNCPIPAAQILAKARGTSLLPGLDAKALGIGTDRQLLVAVTEKRTAAEIAQLARFLKEAVA